MSTILLVMPDLARREAIAEAILALRQTAEIRSAGDPSEAEVGGTDRCDLLIGHAGPRAREGQLLDLVLRAAARTPDARLLLLDDYLEEDAARSESGAICWAPSVATPSHIAHVAQRVLDGDEDFRGSLRDLDLDDVVQLALGTAYRGTLHVRNRRVSGRITFEHGVPIHVEAADRQRGDALAILLSIERGSLLALPFDAPEGAAPLSQDELERAYAAAETLRADGTWSEPEDAPPEPVAETAAADTDQPFFDDDELAELAGDLETGDHAALDGLLGERGERSGRGSTTGGPWHGPATGSTGDLPHPGGSELPLQDAPFLPPAPGRPRRADAPRVPTPALLSDLGRRTDGCQAIALVDLRLGTSTALWARSEAAHTALPALLDLVLGLVRTTEQPGAARSLSLGCWPGTIAAEFDPRGRGLVMALARPHLRTRVTAELQRTLQQVAAHEDAA